jgi:hypothetical protein
VTGNLRALPLAVQGGPDGRAVEVYMSYRLVGEVFKCCRSSSLPPPERLVLLALADRKNSKSGKCCPSVTTLCAMTGYHRTTVLRALAGLEQRGHLTVTRRRRLTSRYVVHPIPLEVAPRDFKRPFLKSLSAQLRSRRATCVVAESDTEPRKEPRRNQEVLPDAPAAHRQAAASRKARKGPRSAAPDTRIAVLYRLFVETHARMLGSKYVARGGEDAAWIKKALGTYGDDAPFRAALPAYFRAVPHRDRVTISVADFVKRIGYLTSRHGRVSPGRPGPRAVVGGRLRHR